MGFERRSILKTLYKSLPSARPVLVTVNPPQADVCATKGVAPSGFFALPFAGPRVSGRSPGWRLLPRTLMRQGERPCHNVVRDWITRGHYSRPDPKGRISLGPLELHPPARWPSLPSCKLLITPCNTHDIPRPQRGCIVRRYRRKLLKTWVLGALQESGTNLAFACLLSNT